MARPPTGKRRPRPATQPVIRIDDTGGDARIAFEVVNLKPADLENLSKAHFTRAQWKDIFSVYVDSHAPADKTDRPAILGAYEIVNKALRFVPRFPVERGLGYRAVFDPAKLPGHAASEKTIVTPFLPVKMRQLANTVVQSIYPTSNKLPENQLKFYIHFSTPMSRGGSYRYIHLIDASGKEVEAPFLELEEELWDPAGKRFTLFFDPGRIKRGLKPREEVGPSLEEGKSYALVIDKDWQDATGSPLKESFRKKFTVGAPDDNPPDTTTWKIEPPPAGSLKPLVVLFPKSMDHALLERTLKLISEKGAAVPGTISVADEEKRWQFTPERAWTAGKYSLAVDKVLEDLAGNSIGRPFEVDVLHPTQQEVKAEIVTLPVQIVASDGKK